MNGEMKCMPVTEMKCDAAMKVDARPLMMTIEESEKLLEGALISVSQIRGALLPMDNLEVTGRPVSDLRDMMELHCERMRLLHRELGNIAVHLGCR